MGKTVVVIGGGPGGYVAAIRAAQLGATVHLIEENSLGGTCLNVGCIPTKALLHAANAFMESHNNEKIGIQAESISFDWSKIQKRKQSVVKKLVRGVGGLLSANGVIVHNGHAILKESCAVQISTGETIAADGVILATGSRPAQIPFEGHDLTGVIDSTGALSLAELPRSLCILGGGVIGTEFAHLFSALGVKVTIVEMLPQILPTTDGQIAAIVRQGLEAQGVTVLTSAKLQQVKQGESGLEAMVSMGEAEQVVECEKLIVAVGRKANTEDIGLDEIGIVTNRGLIQVNQHFETNISGVYAIGDCNGKIMLAHAASAQGEAAVEHLLGQKTQYCCDIMPNCIYTNPEAAGIGLTEEQATSQGILYRVGQFQLSGNGKSLIEGCQNGLIKFLATEDGKILGAHMVGPHVTDMIGEIGVSMHMGATIKDIAATIHAHPTVSEGIVEAALDMDGRAIHWPPRN